MGFFLIRIHISVESELDTKKNLGILDVRKAISLLLVGTFLLHYTKITSVLVSRGVLLGFPSQIYQ